jgi:hypothetical protein
MADRPSTARISWAAIVFALAVLAVLWFVRPVFHGLAMFLWTAPLVWLPPAILLALAAVAVGLPRVSFSLPRRKAPEAPAGRATDPRADPVRLRRRRPSLRRMGRRAGARVAGRGGAKAPRLAATFGILAFVAFFAGSIAIGPLTARSLYKNTDYAEIPDLPGGGQVRLIPMDVAVQNASAGFNSPTERLTDFHIVRTPEGLSWTALRTPNGFLRVFTKKTQGLITLDADRTTRTVEQSDAEFRYAPKVQLTDNLRWQLLKRRYLIRLTEPNAILGPEGRPLIVVPYISYRGVLVRRPALGGVFVVHPDGRIEDLSPEEAQDRPEVAGSGRLFPDALARQIQDAYAFKGGIWNHYFVHEDQTQITDTEANPQPYLVDFGDRGASWVTVAEPYGRAFAANSVFLTDTVTGETRVWRVPPRVSLSGNRRALDVVRSLSIPGIVFAERGAGQSGGGRFRPVEPRPVFVDGRLVYLVSIIPEVGNSVSKTVVVDAESNRAVEIFNNDSDPEADRKTLAFLERGEIGEDPEAAAEPAPEQGEGEPTPGEATPPSGGDGESPEEVRRRLDRLIDRQREILRESEQLRDALGDGGGGGRAP